jgi:hypothetical protein
MAGIVKSGPPGGQGHCVMDDLAQGSLFWFLKEHEMTLKFLTIIISSAVLCNSAIAIAQTSGMHSIRVTLFNQPCSLEGPVEDQVLKAIHAISPDQVYPTFEPGEKYSKVKSALEKLHASKSVPSGLDLYREQLGKRLDAQAVFLKGLEESLSKKNSQPLLASTKALIPEGKTKPFEASAKKLDTKLSPVQRKEVLEQLFAAFSETLPSDPEEEFHKAIHRMKVQYNCSFEESGADDSAE